MKASFNLGLIGYPLGHSLSPKIHVAALESCGLDGDYSLFPIHPENQQGLKDLLYRVRSGEIQGLNVTIPHKQNVVPLLDELSPTAQAIGAVNTISMKNGKLTGDNTDAPGFLTDLRKFLTMKAPRPDRQRWGGQRREDTKSVLVLGAGGAARAVVYALVNDGWDVTIAARRLEQAQELIQHYTSSRTNAHLCFTHYSSLDFPETTLIVNTTPLGMSPNTDTSPWPADLVLPSNAAVYDLVYNPRETKLVRDARAAGIPATTGLGMLIEQAALAFEIWTGCKPQRDILFESVRATRSDDKELGRP
jgi:shikimate dehydrogenase